MHVELADSFIYLSSMFSCIFVYSYSSFMIHCGKLSEINYEINGVEWKIIFIARVMQDIIISFLISNARYYNSIQQD
jgi:hypothetical protein